LTCPHISLSSEYEWDPQNVRFPKASRTVEEEVSRSIGSVRTQGDDYSFNESNDGIDTKEFQVMNIGDLSQRTIANVKVNPTRNRRS
jgi:hypothetical protein